MQLQPLQRALEDLYEIAVPVSADDFLVTDRETITRLAAPPPAESQEAVYVVSDGDEAAIALFIDAGVVSRLADDDPLDELHEGNLADFCVALEAVSHFTYIAWRASHDVPVTQLELEMQAEVDKFVASAMLIGRQAPGRVPRNLLRCLFSSPGFLPGLERVRLERYLRANAYAGRYCEGLHNRFIRSGRGARLTRELRRFYRMNQGQKIRHIESTH